MICERIEWKLALPVIQLEGLYNPVCAVVVVNDGSAEEGARVRYDRLEDGAHLKWLTHSDSCR